MEGSLAIRALQLSAYSAAIDALRASGQNNEQTQKLIQSLQKVFKISETRHSAEVRRACADEKLADLERRSTGRDSSSNWLRRCRRPIPSSSTPIGNRSRQRQSLADQIIESVLTSKTDVPPVHVVLTKVESNSVKEEAIDGEYETSKRKDIAADTTITLPGGTVLRIGEERPELNKPGRKRKGEFVIKEVIESKRPVRNRKFPARFKRSPDKKVISTALKTARKRLNVERIQIPTKVLPKQIKIEAASTTINNNHVSKMESAGDKPPTVSQTIQPQPNIQNGIITADQSMIKAIALTTSNNGNGRMTIVGNATTRRPSKSDDKCDGTIHQVKAENIATVITVNPISVTNNTVQAAPQVALIQTTNNGSNTVFAQSTPTIVVAQHSQRKTTPSTPFLMNDILKSSTSSEKKQEARTTTTVPQVQVQYAQTPAVSSSASIVHQSQHRPPVIAPNNVRTNPSAQQPLHRKSVHEQTIRQAQQSHATIARGGSGRSQENKIIQPHRPTYSRPTLTPPDRRTMVSPRTQPHSPIGNPRQSPQMRTPQTIILPQIPTTLSHSFGLGMQNAVISLSPDHRIARSNQHMVMDQRQNNLIMSNANSNLRQVLFTQTPNAEINQRIQLQQPYLLSQLSPSGVITPQLQPHIQLAPNPHYIQFPTGQIPLERLQNSNNR